MSKRELPSDDLVVHLAHRVLTTERRDVLRRRRGPASSEPECVLIGHAWSDDPARHGGLICIVCNVVRHP